VTGADGLEGRYRRLLAWYPPEHRRRYGEEMIGVLLAAAPDEASRPGLAGAADLVRRGIQARVKVSMRWLAGTNCPDALAVCSVAVPVILASYFSARWLRQVIVGILSGYAYANPVHIQVESALIVAAIAAPPLLGLRSRRAALTVALALAGWYIVIVFGSLPDYVSTLGISGLSQWPWLPSGEGISASLALLLGAAALAWSSGPRRGTLLLRAKCWLVLISTGAAMALSQPYVWTQPLWLVALIVIVALALVAAGLMMSIPGSAGRGVALLLAVPAYPGAVWAIGISRYYTNHVSGFPFRILFAPTVLIACLAMAAVWRHRCKRVVPPSAGDLYAHGR
jgi:hypothetical protein